MSESSERPDLREEFRAANFDLPERLAAAKIADALAPLAPTDQARVVRWALARFWPDTLSVEDADA